MARRLIEADEEFWKRGEEDPATVSAQLAAWRKELTPERLPKQEKSVTGYGTGPDGKLVRLPVPPQRRLTDTPQHRRDYDELRQATARLSAHGQRLGTAPGMPLASLLKSLPADLAEAESVSLWRDFHRVSGALAKHLIAARSKELSPDRLDEICVVDLREVVSSGNIVVMGDPVLQALSDTAIPAQLRPEIVEEAALAQPLVAALVNTPIIADPVVLDDAQANADAIAAAEDNPTDAVLAETATKSQRNIFAALLSGARRTAKSEPAFAAKAIREGAYREIGKQNLAFVEGNWPAFVRYAERAYHYLSSWDLERIIHLVRQALTHWSGP